jgi:hypothetical protein
MHYEALKNFRLNTPSGLLEICPGQNVLLQPERALRLVKVGKLKPIEPEKVGIEEYCKLCSQAIERINNEYYPQALGWIDWTKEHDPKLWEKIEEAEEKLDAPLDRGISLEQYSHLVDQWEALYLKAIGNFLEAQLTEEVNQVPDNQKHLAHAHHINGVKI